MSALNGVPLVMSPNGLAVPLTAKQAMDEERWPRGKKAPVTGWNPYRSGLDLIAELGFMRAPGPYLLARAVMASDFAENIIGVDGHTRQALAWEVKRIGPQVPEALGVKVGDYVIQIGTVSDAVEPRKSHGAEARYCFIHYEDVAAVWDHKALMDALKGTESMDLDALKAHVAQSVSGSAPKPSGD